MTWDRPVELNMIHEGCGGFWESYAEQGATHRYRCSRCKAEGAATRPDEVVAEQRAEMDEWSAKMRASVSALPPPPPPLRTATLDEALILLAYGAWSEETYAAGFMSPAASTVASFIDYLRTYDIDGDYMETMLQLFHEARERQSLDPGGAIMSDVLEPPYVCGAVTADGLDCVELAVFSIHTTEGPLDACLTHLAGLLRNSIHYSATGVVEVSGFEARL